MQLEQIGLLSNLISSRSTINNEHRKHYKLYALLYMSEQSWLKIYNLNFEIIGLITISRQLKLTMTRLMNIRRE